MLEGLTPTSLVSVWAPSVVILLVWSFYRIGWFSVLVAGITIPFALFISTAVQLTQVTSEDSLAILILTNIPILVVTSLVQFASEPITEQARLLHAELDGWMGDQAQMDDITVLGLQL